nr:retrovirus-related Pol polyprotein [Tanacetum cinerariifolium]
MTHLLEKDTPLFFSKECVEAFQTLKRKLTKAPILIAPDWDLLFKLICDASDFAIGETASLGSTPSRVQIKVIDTKGAENLAVDHLSRLENHHQNVLDPKEINDTFPLKTLNMVSFCGNSSTPWFADFENYHAGKFVVKGMSSQKPLTFSRLATMDPLRDIMARTTPLRRERFRNEMKCLKIPSKFTKFSTFGALTSWGRSRLHKGTNIYS